MLKVNRIQLKMGNCYWIATLLILAFVGANDSFKEYPLVVFHIYGAKYIYHLLISAIILGVLCFSRKALSVNVIFFLLLAKAGFDFFGSYVLNGVDFLTNWYFFICTDLGMLFYLLCYNSAFSLHQVVKLYRIFAVVLSFQVLAVYIYHRGTGLLMSDLTYKACMRVPFAASNVIASAIIPAALCIFCTQYKKKIVGIIEFVVYFLALVLLKSRGAILVFAFLAELYIVLLIKNMKRLSNKMIVGTFFVLVNIVVAYFVLRSSFFRLYFTGYKGFSSLNDITSRRMEVWQYSLNEFLEHPLLGRGLYYDDSEFIGSTGAHNIILETLMNSGITGFIFHFCVVIKLLQMRVGKTKLRKLLVIGKASQDKLCTVVILVTLYVNSMVEVSYYNYINDVLFWSLAGFLSRDCKDDTTRMLRVEGTVAKSGG